MKRLAELHPLSREHRDGLIHARHLRLAGGGKEPLEPAVAEFLAAWREVLIPHFRVEEEVLAPLFARATGPDHPLIVQMLAEHVALRAAVQALGETDGAERRQRVGELGRALDDHIRFEERVLFPAMEAAVTPEEWERAAPMLAGHGESRAPNPPRPSSKTQP